MKIKLFIGLLLASMSLSAQQMKIIGAYFRMDGTRYVGVSTDNQLWTFAKKKWQPFGGAQLPEKSIKFMDVGMEIVFAAYRVKVVAVQEDNTIWWNTNGKTWERISPKGLPADAGITDFCMYVNPESFNGSESRFLALMNNNTMWWHSLGDPWKQIPSETLPAGDSVRYLRAYYKPGMIGGTRCIAKLKSNELWWFDGAKWKKFECPGRPGTEPFKHFEVYAKRAGSYGVEEGGRIVAVLEDNSIWWCTVDGKSWSPMDTKGLPDGFQVRYLKSYQKNTGYTCETRLIVLLEDGSMWWYANGNGWEKVPMEGLK
jgi:hypothetical protein